MILLRYCNWYISFVQILWLVCQFVKILWLICEFFWVLPFICEFVGVFWFLVSLFLFSHCFDYMIVVLLTRPSFQVCTRNFLNVVTYIMIFSLFCLHVINSITWSCLFTVSFIYLTKTSIMSSHKLWCFSLGNIW